MEVPMAEDKERKDGPLNSGAAAFKAEIMVGGESAIMILTKADLKCDPGSPSRMLLRVIPLEDQDLNCLQ